MKLCIKNIFCTVLIFAALLSFGQELPEGFVYVKDQIPNIILEMRYCSDNNFTGRKVDGYIEPKAILTQKATAQLKMAQEELNKYNLGFKIYDAYRPQQAVNCFIRWAKDINDQKTKSAYYPNVLKENLFREGYIAARSSHTRGSTVDITIVSLNYADHNKELDMGGPFDYFDKQSWSEYSNITAQQKANRLLLKLIMEKYGFEPYPYEWWHFTLKNEPFPNKYFNFPVK